MNIKYIFLTLLSITFYSCNSQEHIDFKVGYLPNHNYILTQNIVSENNVKYIASDKILQKLKENGVENPTVTTETNYLKSISKTGNLKSNRLPIEVEILDSSNPVLKKGSDVYGHTLNNKVKIDSITSTALTDDRRKALMPAIESALQQIEYPSKVFRVGESFEQESETSMSVAEETLLLKIKSKYTLGRIENSTGYFSLIQEYVIESAPKDLEFEFSGYGTGQIQFDERLQFFTKFFLEMEMDLKMELKTFTIEVKTRNTTDQSTEVEKASR